MMMDMIFMCVVEHRVGEKTTKTLKESIKHYASTTLLLDIVSNLVVLNNLLNVDKNMTRYNVFASFLMENFSLLET
jgi:hypothetical protein